MSKSLGNYIGITDSPAEMFGKVMSVNDELMFRYYELLTDVPAKEIARIKQEIAAGTLNPMAVKIDLAKSIIADFHSQAAAEAAEAEFIKVFRTGRPRTTPRSWPWPTDEAAGRFPRAPRHPLLARRGQAPPRPGRHLPGR